MAITYTGDGLTVLIQCDYLLHHDWMGFLSRYSLMKYLPDAKVIVGVNRKEMLGPIMYWPRRSGATLFMHKVMGRDEESRIARQKYGVEGPMLLMPPHFACLRDFDEASFDTSALGCGDIDVTSADFGLSSGIRTNNPSVFLDYSGGWGSFVPTTWINKLAVPLFTDENYATVEMSANELRMARIWKPASKMYETLCGG